MLNKGTYNFELDHMLSEGRESFVYFYFPEVLLTHVVVTEMPPEPRFTASQFSSSAEEWDDNKAFASQDWCEESMGKDL